MGVIARPRTHQTTLNRDGSVSAPPVIIHSAYLGPLLNPHKLQRPVSHWLRIHLDILVQSDLNTLIFATCFGQAEIGILHRCLTPRSISRLHRISPTHRAWTRENSDLIRSWRRYLDHRERYQSRKLGGTGAAQVSAPQPRRKRSAVCCHLSHNPSCLIKQPTHLCG